MPITVALMQQAAARGLSVVCSTCQKYWQARDRGILGDRCLGKACGSPLAGDVFHEYSGAMTHEAMLDFCFVCGARSARALRIPGKTRMIGVCLDHLKFMFELVPIGTVVGDAPTLVRVPGGSEFLVEEITPARRPKLVEMMIETEREWANKYGWEFDPKDPFRTGKQNS